MKTTRRDFIKMAFSAMMMALGMPKKAEMEPEDELPDCPFEVQVHYEQCDTLPECEDCLVFVVEADEIVNTGYIDAVVNTPCSPMDSVTGDMIRRNVKLQLDNAPWVSAKIENVVWTPEGNDS